MASCQYIGKKSILHNFIFLFKLLIINTLNSLAHRLYPFNKRENMNLIYDSYLTNKTFQLMARVITAGLVILISLNEEAPLLNRELDKTNELVKKEHVINLSQLILTP